MKKNSRFIIHWIFLSGALLLSILILPLIDIIKSCFVLESEPPAFFNDTQIIYGVIGEVFRALILLYLYPMLKDAGKNYRHAIVFGILTTGLVWTLWVVYGAGAFDLNNPISFFIEETIVFLIQGIFSGIALYLIYRKKENKLQV